MTSENFTFTRPTRFYVDGQWHSLDDNTWQNLYAAMLRLMWNFDRGRFERRILTLQGSKLPWFSMNPGDLNTHEIIKLDFCGYYAYAKLSAEAIAKRCQRIAKEMGVSEGFDIETNEYGHARSVFSVSSTPIKNEPQPTKVAPVPQFHNITPQSNGLAEIIDQLKAHRQRIETLRVANNRLHSENEDLRAKAQVKVVDSPSQPDIKTLNEECERLREENRTLTALVVKLAKECEMRR